MYLFLPSSRQGLFSLLYCIGTGRYHACDWDVAVQGLPGGSEHAMQAG